MPQEQVHATPTSQPRKDVTAEEADRMAEEAAIAQAHTGDVTTEDADAWLDEIDEALEENGSTSELAALFVGAFVQKGGE